MFQNRLYLSNTVRRYCLTIDEKLREAYKPFRPIEILNY